ncbi:MAG TPA: DUF1189 domain-containing protein [Pyrinomonadaceae bacterium]|jgi:hypothetical protein|nr:DUF1189 domain-containing protein [Pyrinomonadaceae bacterium]
MKRYSIFHPLVLSFFSKSLYRDVGKNWRGTGLLYLLLVILLLWIPATIKGHRDFGRFVDDDAKGITEQIPAVRITNGQVSTDASMPHSIKDPKTGATLAIIDTVDTSVEAKNPSVPLILTKTKLVMRKNASETQIFDLSGVQNFYVDRARVEGWLATARTWFFPVFYPVAVFFSFIFRGIQILIYALIGLGFAAMLHAKLDYKTLMRLSAIAITPVMILNLLFELVPFHLPGWTLLGIIIGLGYLFFAVKANAEEDVPQYRPPAAYPPAMR